MRTLTPAQEAAWRSAGSVAHLRVRIAGVDGLADWTDLIGGQGWIESATWGEGDDQPGQDGTITTFWRRYHDNASPFVEAGQRLEGALLTGARVLIDVAVMPDDVEPGAGDWQTVMDAQIDQIGLDYPVAQVTLRDRIIAQLQDRWVEEDRVYGSPEGRPLEHVIQDLLDDWAGSPAQAIFTPVTPSFLITPYNAAAGPLLDAIAQLGDVIGWQVRPRWAAGSGAFLLALTEPDRAATTPVFTFLPSEILNWGAVGISIEDVRNAVEVLYTDGTKDAGGQLVVKRAYAEDLASQAKYGRRWFSLTEGSSSQINTQAEAEALAEAILSDLAEPSVQAAVEVPLCWWLELGDLVRIPGDGERFGTNQDLAIVGIRHTVNAQETPKTTLQLYGKPRAGRRNWMEREARPGVAPGTTSRTPATPLPPDVRSLPNAVEVLARWPGTQGFQALEFHRSTTLDFTPSATTLMQRGLERQCIDERGAEDETTYYKIVVVDQHGNRSAASAQSIGSLSWTPPARLAKALSALVMLKRQTSDQTVSASGTVLQMSEILDPQGAWAAASFWYIPPATGIYRLTVDFLVSFDAAANYEIYLERDSDSAKAWTTGTRAAVTEQVRDTELVELTAGQKYSFQLDRNAGTAYFEVGSKASIEPTLSLASDTSPRIQPANPPTISGTTDGGAGQVLTCTTGTWDASPTPTYTRQWLRAGVPISGATGSTYTLVSADVGQPIACVVTATNRAGKGSAVTAEVGPITVAPSIAADPVASGDTVVGSVLTCTTGTWYGAPAPTYTYQWWRATGPDVPITGETRNTYTTTDTDSGFDVYCIVTATNPLGTASQPSNSVGPIDSGAVAPVNTVAPVVSGTTTEGQTLACTEGTWTGTLPITYAYIWISDDGLLGDIVGTDSPTYTLQASDVGNTISCTVEATNAAGTVQAVSNTVGPIASAATPPVNTVAPVASGVIRIGELLSTTDGTWTGTPAPTFAYQWTRDGAPIGSATSSTYTVVAADMACEIACEVTATNSAGSAMESSNSLASPWRDILVARPGVLIYDHTDPYCSGGASVGSPVADLYTVDGVLIGSQATSGSRPTRTADGLSFDGTDDHLICNSHASLTEQAHTMIWGFDDPEDSTTAVRTLFCASASSSAATTRQTSVNFSRPGSTNATRQRYYISETSSISVSLTGASAGAGPYNWALRAAAPGGTMAAVHLDASLTAINSGTRSADDGVSYAWCYLGCRAVAGTPALAQYWQGVIRHFAVDDTQWSDTDTQTYRACAIAAGVM